MSEQSEVRIEYNELADPHVYGAAIAAVAGMVLMAWVAVDTTDSMPLQYLMLAAGAAPGFGYGVARIKSQEQRYKERFA